MNASTARRRLLLLIALFSFGAIAMALLSQYAFDMMPCAWCVLQRLIYLCIGVIALVAAYAPPRWLPAWAVGCAPYWPPAAWRRPGINTAWPPRCCPATRLLPTVSSRPPDWMAPCPRSSEFMPRAWTPWSVYWASNTRSGVWPCSWCCFSWRCRRCATAAESGPPQKQHPPWTTPLKKADADPTFFGGPTNSHVVGSVAHIELQTTSQIFSRRRLTRLTQAREILGRDVTGDVLAIEA